MFGERYDRIKTAWENQIKSNAEFREFTKIFDPLMPLDGVLTQKDFKELDPLLRGLIVSKNLIRHMDKLQKGKEATEDEKREVREAAWYSSVNGRYDINFDIDKQQTSVSVDVDDSDRLDLWLTNKESLIAYYSLFEGKRLRYIKNNGYDIDDGRFPLTFNFPNVLAISAIDWLFVSCVDKQIYKKTHFVLINPILPLEKD